MNPQRAKDLIRLARYSNGGCLNADAVRPDVAEMTAEEDRMVRMIWKSMSGGSCMNDVLHDIANGRCLVTMLATSLTHHINQPNNGLA